MAIRFYPNAVGLREATDWASSIRGVPSFYALDEQGVQRRPVGGPSDGATVVIRADTPVIGDRPRPAVKHGVLVDEYGAKFDLTAIPVRNPDGTETTVAADSVFWSEASVEKFLFPYYASKMQWDAPNALVVMAEQWYGYVPGEPEEVAAARRQRRARIAAERNGSGGSIRAEEGGEEPLPFAIAHIPRSDYVDTSGDEGPMTGEAGSTTVSGGTDFAFLTYRKVRDENGEETRKVHGVLLSALLAR